MGKLDGRTALITGGSSGMALSTAKLFERERAFVIVTGRDRRRLDAAVDEIGMNALGVVCDASDPADIAARCSPCRRRYRSCATTRPSS